MSFYLIEEFREARERFVQCDDRVKELVAIIKSSSEWQNAPEFFVDLVDREKPYNARAYIDAINSFNSKWATDKKKLSALGSVRFWAEQYEKYENKLRAAFEQLKEESRIMAAGGELFFRGCDTREKLDKRYKALAKVFHPDSETGDMQTMQIINAEYERQKDDMCEDAVT